MTELTTRFENEARELMKLFMDKFGGDILDMDVDEFAAIQKFMKLMDLSFEIVVKQAEMLDNQSKKIDELLKLAKKA